MEFSTSIEVQPLRAARLELIKRLIGDKETILCIDETGKVSLINLLYE